MWIGAGKIILDFYGNDSLKKKKNEIRSLQKELQKHFNISLLEVDEFDDLEKCVLGFSIVIPSRLSSTKARDLVDEVCRFIDQNAFTRVILEDWDLLSY